MERLTAFGYNLIACYMIFLIIFGGIAQVVTLIVLVRSKDLKTKSLTPYLINVVIANTIMVVGSFPSTFASAIANRWLFDDVMCRIVGFLGGIAAVGMIASMACITVKIHSTITARSASQSQMIPVKKNKYPTYLKVIVSIWIYSVFSMLPPTAGWTSMIKESADLNCAPNWKTEGTADLVYILTLTSMAYIIPVTISSYYHWKINKAINSHLKTVARFSSAQRQLDGFRNISKMAGLAILAFTVTWLPYCVYVLISAFGGSKLIDANTSVIACLVAKSSILYNPFIYALVNPRSVFD